MQYELEIAESKIQNVKRLFSEGVLLKYLFMYVKHYSEFVFVRERAVQITKTYAHFNSCLFQKGDQITGYML